MPSLFYILNVQARLGTDKARVQAQFGHSLGKLGHRLGTVRAQFRHDFVNGSGTA